jgi:hypothetical protein
MTGRQEYDRTKDRQRILGKYMIDEKEKCGKPKTNTPRNRTAIIYNVLKKSVQNSAKIKAYHIRGCRCFSTAQSVWSVGVLFTR